MSEVCKKCETPEGDWDLGACTCYEETLGRNKSLKLCMTGQLVDFILSDDYPYASPLDYEDEEVCRAKLLDALTNFIEKDEKL